MPDCVLIPLQNLGVLALSREEFEAALAEGARLTGTTRTPPEKSEDLLDAEHAAQRLAVSSRWLEDSARAGIVPHYKMGRYIRFRVAEVAIHCRVDGAPLPNGDVGMRGVPAK